MPSRRKTKPPPQFSFVTLDFDGTAVSWLNIHSGAVRRHAAYWGGPVKHQEKNDVARPQRTYTSIISSTDTTSYLQNSDESAPGCVVDSKDAKSISSRFNAGRKFQRCVEPDVLQHLPPVSSEIKAAAAASGLGLSTLKFLGEEFAKRFLLFDHEDYSVMFSGFLLHNYAYSMALTGRGSKRKLLELKAHVIRCVGAKLKSSNGVLSPQCLSSIHALAAPLVCLLSQELPQNLSVGEYLIASMQDDCLCCPDSAETAQRNLRERNIHRRAMRRLLADSSTIYRDADNFSLLQYVSRRMNM